MYQNHPSLQNPKFTPKRLRLPPCRPPPFSSGNEKGEGEEAFKRKSRKRQNFPPPRTPFSPTGRDLYGGSPPQPLPSKKGRFFCLPPSPDLKPPRERRREECCNQSQKRTFFPLIESREPHFSPLGDQPSFLPTPPHHLLCPPTYLLRTALQKGRPVQYFRRSKSLLRALMKENHR